MAVILTDWAAVRYIDPVSWPDVPALTEAEARAYAEVSHQLDLDARPVTIGEIRGVLFSLEVPHADCTDAGAPIAEETAWARVQALAEALQGAGMRVALTGRRSGFCGRHELGAVATFGDDLPAAADTWRTVTTQR